MTFFIMPINPNYFDFAYYFTLFIILLIMLVMFNMLIAVIIWTMLTMLINGILCYVD